MTPPAPAKKVADNKPVQPEPPKVETKAETKVEAKGEAKVETPPVPSPDAKKDDAKASASAIDFGDWSAYSLVLGGGYGWRNLGNDQGMDHGGGYFKAAAGLNFRFFDDRFKLTPRFFFEHQGLHKDLGEGITSDASINAVGVEIDAGYAIHRDWFSIHGIFGLGAALYSSPDTTDGLNGGTEFNKNALKFPLNGTALRVQPGIALCTLNSSICLNTTYAIDSGLNPKIEVVDGNYPPMGLSPAGFTLGGSVDVLGAIDFFAGKRRKKVAAEAEKATPPPEGDKKPDDKKGPEVKPGGPDAAKKTPEKVSGLALIEQDAKKAGELSEEAKVNGQVAKTDADDYKKEKDAGQQKALATDTIFNFREASKRQDSIEKLIAGMEAEAAKLEGADKKKAEGLIADAKKQRDAANTAARSAWDSANTTVKAYNKGKTGTDQLDFPDTKPDATGRPTGKKPADKKPADKKPEDKKPADKKPEDKKPEDKKPADKKPDDKKGGIVFDE